MSSSKTKSKESAYPGSATFQRHRQEFQDYLPVVQGVQDDLKADIAELQDQEGWELDTAEGIREWSDDTNTIWRILRVNDPLATDVEMRGADPISGIGMIPTKPTRHC